MKNITIALDDDVYRRARITAARRDTSVSALVKQYLLTLMSEEEPARDFVQEQDALLDQIWREHPGFTTSENLSRDALHERTDP
jgi:plasmid stability protein